MSIDNIKTDRYSHPDYLIEHCAEHDEYDEEPSDEDDEDETYEETEEYECDADIYNWDER
jgi:hypothetical protein